MTPVSPPNSTPSTILATDKPANDQQSTYQEQKVQVSIVLPTYNEAGSIIQLLESIKLHLPKELTAEIVVVDDSSPDGTGKTVLKFAEKVGADLATGAFNIRLITRPAKSGLSSAILAGARSASGEMIVIMDSDLSHPPEIIPRMIVELQTNPLYDMVVASRYVEGGSIAGWTTKRRVISKGATSIAQTILGVRERDPMSGFFAFRRRVIEGIEFDAIGYKLLLEILVKSRASSIKEIPYCFTDRISGMSKLDNQVMVDYVRAVWRLYSHGSKNNGVKAESQEKRVSVRFLSKAARFYTVGASGLFVNYVVSMAFAALWADLWYLYATGIGISASMTSNFLLNKIWTFEDRKFNAKAAMTQYGLFMGFSSLGAAIQLAMVYLLREIYHVDYAIALVLAVITAATGNFVLNKKWTFRQKVWS